MALNRSYSDVHVYVLVSLHRAVDSETAPQTQKKAPIFSEPAQIQTVDTVEGLICTHEVCVHAMYYAIGIGGYLPLAVLCS